MSYEFNSLLIKILYYATNLRINFIFQKKKNFLIIKKILTMNQMNCNSSEHKNECLILFSF